jgi:hypothetical protein
MFSGIAASPLRPAELGLGQLPRQALGGDNRAMPKGPQAERSTAGGRARPFSHGSMVVVTLGNPRDKFWGMILELAAEGLSIRGIELASFEDLVVMVKDGEASTAAVVFFPMHRIERIELDLPDGSVPSLSQRFSAQTGLNPAELLGSDEKTATTRSAAPAGKDPA